MARGVNKVIIVGNLGEDPETRYMPSGSAVTNLRIATSESWKDKTTGEAHERTEWHDIAMFARLAEIAAEYLRKGSQVYIEGRSVPASGRTRPAGQDRYTTEIIADEMQMLGGKPAVAAAWAPASERSRLASRRSRSGQRPAQRRRRVRRRHSVLNLSEPQGQHWLNASSSDVRLSNERVRLGQDGRRARRFIQCAAAKRPSKRDILLLNTCSVRDKAQEKVFSLLGRWRGAQRRAAAHDHRRRRLRREPGGRGAA